jgi:hypothetical protein
MDLGLRGRKAFVAAATKGTSGGTTKGIRLSIGEHLAVQGASVAICAGDAGQLAAAVARQNTAVFNASGYPGDWTRVELIARPADGDRQHSRLWRRIWISG